MRDAGAKRAVGRPVEGQLLFPGIAFVAAAIVGGGFKAFGIEIPLLASPVRQALLGALGLAMIIASFFVKTGRAGGITMRESPPVLEGLGRAAPTLLIVLPSLLIAGLAPELFDSR